MDTGIPYSMTDFDRQFLAGSLKGLKDINILQYKAAKQRALDLMKKKGYPDTENFLHYFTIQFAIDPSFDFPDYLTFMENKNNRRQLWEWGVRV